MQKASEQFLYVAEAESAVANWVDEQSFTLRLSVKSFVMDGVYKNISFIFSCQGREWNRKLQETYFCLEVVRSIERPPNNLLYATVLYGRPTSGNFVRLISAPTILRHTSYEL